MSFYARVDSKKGRSVIHVDNQVIFEALNSGPSVEVKDIVKACDYRWMSNRLSSYIKRHFVKIDPEGCEDTMNLFHSLMRQGRKQIDCGNICNERLSVNYDSELYGKTYRAWLSDTNNMNFTHLIVSAWNKQGLSELAA